MTDNEHTRQMQEKILAAAEKVFEANGYTQTTIDAVAAEAGIAKGSTYNYFSSKRKLFIGVFLRAIERQRKEVKELLDETLSASQKLFRILDDWFEQMAYYKRIGGLFLEFWATAAREEQEGEVATTVHEMYGSWREMFAPIISEGVKTGEFRRQVDPNMAATLIMSIADGITVHAILDSGLKVDEELLAAIKRAIMAGLGTTEPAG